MKLPSRIFLIISVIMLSVTAIAVNDRHFVNADESDKELEKIEDQIDETKDEISKLSEKINGIKGEIDNLSGSLSQVLATISSVEAEINEIIVTINKVTTELNSHSATLTSQTVIRDRTLRNFYKKGPSGAVSTIIRSNALLSSESDTSGYLRKYIFPVVDIYKHNFALQLLVPLALP